MLPLIDLSPCDIRFMHHRINNQFSNGNSVNETIERIARGEMSVGRLPKIRVVKINNSYYAFDNRRLYVYRVLHYRGLLNEIKVYLAPLSQFQPKRFSTKNNGLSIIVRGDTTLKHSLAGDQSISPTSRNSEATSSNAFVHSFERLSINNATRNRTLYEDDSSSNDGDYNFHVTAPRQDSGASLRYSSYAVTSHPSSLSTARNSAAWKSVYGDSDCDDDISVVPALLYQPRTHVGKSRSTTAIRHSDTADVPRVSQTTTTRNSSSLWYQEYLRKLEERKSSTLKPAYQTSAYSTRHATSSLKSSTSASTVRDTSLNLMGTSRISSTQTPRNYYLNDSKETAVSRSSYASRDYSTLSRPASSYSSSYARPSTSNSYMDLYGSGSSRTTNFTSTSAYSAKKSNKESSCIIL